MQVNFTRDNQILTTNPIYNDILNRGCERIKNTELSKVSDRVNRINKKIGQAVTDLNGEIEKSVLEIKRLKREQKCSDGISEFIKSDKSLSREKERQAELIAKRDNLIESELPVGEYREIIKAILTESDKERQKRIKDIIGHLTTVEELMNEQYNQTHAISELLRTVTGFNGTKHQEVADSIVTDKRDMFGNITITDDVSIVRKAHIVGNLINEMNKAN